MATIRTAIELDDNFTGVLNNIVNAMNMTVSVMEQMQSAMNSPVDPSSLDGVRDYANQATVAVQELNAALQATEPPEMPTPIPEPPESVEIPVVWQSDTMDIFTNTGIERFEQEVQSANNMLNTLNQTQNQIAQTAANTNLFPADMVADMNNMQTRLQAIKQRIEEIENNPLNMGTDAANSELEQLRGQLDQALQEQQELNAAVDNMDVEAANQAYLRLSSTVRGTEIYIRDNVNEQGRFNSVIQDGTEEASKLQGMIASAVGAFVGVAGIKKAFSFVEDCTESFNTQLNAETQLISVLANMLDEDYVAQFELETTADTTGAINEINAIQNSVDEVVVPVTAESKALVAAYDQITAKASEIQSRGIYGDEAMIAAGAEFATYFTDVDAITTMMDTLTNYAMGMSGGGEIDTTAMVDYATNLGKIMSGSYDAMTKKGFEFTDAQKHVIEGTATESELVSVLGDEWADMSRDMQAAAAISQVIDESWAGLYETMSNTPQGKIIQLTNAWGDMKEVIGGELYPYVIAFVDTINNNWGTITAVVDGITQALQFMMGVLNSVLQAAISVAQGIVNHWSIIAPIIGVVTAALTAYLAVLAIYKVSQAIANGITAAAALAKKAHAAALMMEQGATFAATVAQYGFNAALLACPITWIVAAIIGIIAVLYIVIGVINEVAGTAISATGIICGAFMAAAAFVGNLFVSMINFVTDIFVAFWNFIAAFANFFANVFTDPVSAVAHLFFDLVDTVLSLLQALASAIDTIFGSNLANSVQGWRNSLSGWVDKTFGQSEEIMPQLNAEDMHLGRFEYSSAWNVGYSFGKGIEDTVSNFDLSSLFDTNIPSANDYAYALDNSGVGSGVGDISENTESMAESLSATDEDLKYLRDIAERQAINQFTTAELKVDFTSNANINSEMDIDGIVSRFAERIQEELINTAEGVHI